jgi:hypothetical protein
MMRDILLKDYGWCQIIQRNDKYFIYYDGGGVTVQMKTIEINKKQLEISIIDQFKAEQVIREILSKR